MKKIAYCTIASANYLARVEVLRASLLNHNPGAEFHILLCEAPEVCNRISAEVEVPFLAPDHVCAQWRDMAFYYNITEYNTALKPFLIEFLYERGYSAVVYIDPDIEIFSSLQTVEKLLEEYDLILTPHVCKPMSMDGLRPGIDDIVRAGQFNLGFIALADSKESREALKWWQGVCLEYCVFDTQHRYFVDQFWADILPSFIQRFYCLRDPGYNMAYWNIFQRELSCENGKWMADAEPLRFFHFSGLAKDDLTLVSIHQNRVTAPVGSPLHTLLSAYFDRLRKAIWSRYDSVPYSFRVYSTGEMISPRERRKFLYLGAGKRNSVGDPFAAPAAIRAIKSVDLDRQDPDELQSGSQLQRFKRCIRHLGREYLASLRSHGFVSTHCTVFRFVSRKMQVLPRKE